MLSKVCIPGNIWSLSRLGGSKLNSSRIPLHDFNQGLLCQQLRMCFYQPKNELQEIKSDKQKNALEEMGDRYVYDRVSFKVVNNDKFLEKIKRMEAESKGDKPKLEGIKFPFLLVFFTVFIWYQWETIPYKVVYKHATINENIFNKNYYHAVFTSALSLMNKTALATYGPAMVYSIYLCGIYMRQRHMFYLFASNAIITSALTYLIELNKDSPVPMITPKANGAVTPLAFMSAFLAFKPKYNVMGSKGMPFFIIPATYFMYECYQLKNSPSNEVSRPANITAMIYGALFGLALKRFTL